MGGTFKVTHLPKKHIQFVPNVSMLSPINVCRAAFLCNKVCTGVTFVLEMFAVRVHCACVHTQYLWRSCDVLSALAVQSFAVITNTFVISRFILIPPRSFSITHHLAASWAAGWAFVTRRRAVIFSTCAALTRRDSRRVVTFFKMHDQYYTHSI